MSSSSFLPHVIVLQHGVLGHPSSLDRIANTLRREDPRVIILQPPSNDSGKFLHRFLWNPTYEGVEVGGIRLAEYLKEELQSLLPCRLSMVGHSLGGLYCRVAIGVLEEEGWFTEDKITPVCFATLASPHLGVRDSAPGIQAGCFLVPSGRDLMGLTPVLDKLHQGHYLSGLRKFHKRAVYGNTNLDSVVGTHSSLLSLESPNLMSRVEGCAHICPPLVGAGEKMVEVARRVFRRPDAGKEESSAPSKSVLHLELKWLEALSTMTWDRFPVLFEKGNAHCLITSNEAVDTYQEGQDVVKHLCRQLLSAADAHHRHHRRSQPRAGLSLSSSLMSSSSFTTSSKRHSTHSSANSSSKSSLSSHSIGYGMSHSSDSVSLEGSSEWVSPAMQTSVHKVHGAPTSWSTPAAYSRSEFPLYGPSYSSPTVFSV